MKQSQNKNSSDFHKQETIMEESQYKKFSDFQKQDFLTDIQIKLSNGSINAHKLILAANSEFFKMLFNNPSCKEMMAGVVDLPSIDCSIFGFILDYIYGRIGVEGFPSDVSVLIEIVVASDFLGMIEFIKFLDSRMSIQYSESYLEYFDRIICYNLNKTIRKCQKKIIASIMKRSYCDLLKLSPESLSLLIADDGFAIEENALFGFLQFFLEECKEGISETIHKKLVGNIRYSLLNQTQKIDYCALARSLSLEEPSSQSPRCVPFVFVVSDAHGCVQRVDVVDGEVTKAISLYSPGLSVREGFGRWLLLSQDVISFGESLGTLHNLVRDGEITVEPIRCKLNDIDCYQHYVSFARLMLNWHLIVLGGYYFTSESVIVPTSTVLEYDFGTCEWRCLAVGLREPCWSHAVTMDTQSTQRVIYVSGGRNCQGYLRQFYRLDLETGAVTDLPPLPRDMSGHRMCQGGDTVAVLDGNQGHEVLLYGLRDRAWRSIDLTIEGPHVHLSSCCYCFHGESEGTMTFFVLANDVEKGGVRVCRRDVVAGVVVRPSETVAVLEFSEVSNVVVALGVHGVDCVSVGGPEYDGGFSPVGGDSD